jgi:small subunit ribosomal protein S17
MTEEKMVEDTTAETATAEATPAEATPAEATPAETAPAEAPPVAVADAPRGRGRRQVLQGVVVSEKMDKTVIVTVSNTVMHPLYQRYIRRSAKFYAHDERNECRTGDQVAIVATRPLSKTKRWRVREILKRAE